MMHPPIHAISQFDQEAEKLVRSLPRFLRQFCTFLHDEGFTREEAFELTRTYLAGFAQTSVIKQMERGEFDIK